jgi:hypothetical protein
VVSEGVGRAQAATNEVSSDSLVVKDIRALRKKPARSSGVVTRYKFVLSKSWRMVHAAGSSPTSKPHTFFWWAARAAQRHSWRAAPTPAQRPHMPVCHAEISSGKAWANLGAASKKLLESIPYASHLERLLDAGFLCVQPICSSSCRNHCCRAICLRWGYHLKPCGRSRCTQTSSSRPHPRPRRLSRR